jgi:hypothetical protein
VKTILRALFLMIFAAELLAACGDGGSAAAANSTPAPSAAAGVKTPKAVSVVTAN